MKKPHCALCGVDPSEHSDLYCDMLKQERENYERKLKLVRKMNRILRRDIDSLDNQLEEMKKYADVREADMKSFKKNRDEWKQACQTAIADRDAWQQVSTTSPTIKRISELCEKVTLRDVQITDLTIERDSYKSMYQSSQDINAGLTKEHNELKAAYEQIACSQPTPAEHLTNQMFKLISSMNEAGAATVRPAPGRLEIAAMILAGLAVDSGLTLTQEECAEEAMSLAIELIKADKKADQA